MMSPVPCPDVLAAERERVLFMERMERRAWRMSVCASAVANAMAAVVTVAFGVLGWAAMFGVFLTDGVLWPAVPVAAAVVALVMFFWRETFGRLCAYYSAVHDASLHCCLLARDRLAAVERAARERGF